MSKFKNGEIVFLFSGEGVNTKISLLKIINASLIIKGNSKGVFKNEIFQYRVESEHGLNLTFKEGNPNITKL